MNACFSKSLVFRAALVTILVLGCGTKACQEDYELGTQSSIKDKTTTTTSSTSTTSTTDDVSDTTTTTGDEETTTTTSTSSTTTTTGTESKGLLGALSNLNDEIDVSNPAAAGAKPSNWLGKIYDKEEVAGQAVDSDGDGYSDLLESDAGSNPTDPRVTPPPPVTRLADRLDSVDDDRDGLNLQDERKRGTDPIKRDTDADGVDDGAEQLSGSDPLDPGSRPDDLDGDGLANEFEVSLGLDSQSQDTDLDGVRDDVELALGMNALSNDTDRDGVLDGKEIELGSDPVRPESPS
jgi:hypothetical protein